jgi:integrase/recombinase XerD
MEEQILSFIDYLATQRRYAPNTLLAYRNDLMQLLQFVHSERPHIGSWARVDGLLLQAFLLQMKARELSAASIARKIAAIKSFYFYLVENAQLVSNPAQDLEAPAVPKQPPHALSPQQVASLLDAASDSTPKGIRDRAILEVLYAAGLRVSELVVVRFDAIDFRSGSLQVDGVEGTRLLTLSPRALEALRTYLERGRPLLTDGEGGLLFVNSRGTGLTRQGVWLILKEYVRRAGMEGDVTPHSLRHAFAAHRLAQGERVQDLQRLLGHAHLSTTLVYSRAREESAR